MKSSCFLIISVFLFVSYNFAQTDSSKVVITLKDNTTLHGSIEQQDSSTVIFLTKQNIRMEIPRNQIADIFYQTKEKQYPFQDPNSTRLFFAPTARSLKHGEGYVADYWVFFPFVAVGAFDRLTIAGGMTLIPRADAQLLYLAPKVNFYQKNKIGVAVGVLYLTLSDFTEEGVGIAYGVGTVGDRDRALTLGLGWAYAGSDVSNKPVVLVGGEQRISESIKLISENWILPDTEFSLISMGIRFFGRNLAADLALVYPLGADTGGGFPFMPWLSFAYNF